jgi:hypothetical protein
MFSVTYSLVLPGSAEQGDFAECGDIARHVGLREAIQHVMETRTSAVDCVESIEADSWPCSRPRWLTVANGAEFETGAYESRSLHIPPHVTPASARRIARLLGVRL